MVHLTCSELQVYHFMKQRLLLKYKLYNIRDRLGSFSMRGKLSSRLTREFVILGPKLIRDNRVLEAIHSLYFLPENFKMIFISGPSTDHSLISEITTMLKRNALGHRVRFHKHPQASQAVIADSKDVEIVENVVTGDSPEALASAILNIARAA